MDQKFDYTLRPLKKSDADLLKYWGRFDDPILYGYEYNDLDEDEKEIWYRLKTRQNSAQYYSIIMEDKFVGYIGIKEINYISKKAQLGIVLDPNYVSMGLGSEAMKTFLSIYFKLKKYKKLFLEVNSWNERAIKLYKKLGFKVYDSYFQKFENQDINLDSVDNHEKHFKISRGNIYSKIFKMSLDRKDYINED